MENKSTEGEHHDELFVIRKGRWTFVWGVVGALARVWGSLAKAETVAVPLPVFPTINVCNVTLVD